MKVLICALLSLSTVAAQAGDVVRYPLPDGNKFPISSAVEVPAGTVLVFQSGATASPKDPSATPGTPEYWGDTKTQTISALENIKKSLATEGLDFGDVVKMLAFVAGDPANGGKMDFAGLNKAWLKEFGTPAEPNKPARAAVQVAALAAPGALVEIEFIAARKAK